ncbi:plastocyanin/azurin family copper-binding protein [Halalkaliarchaeum desulfuricum]|uniref:plastocyanin/azurin family copper-binding protein n=1 Tax=Halalkaliarchaeum desulfuricum TaxID=2055893 RepID=UPI001C30B1E1|nr:plastocyanin/azurin family copper-binding protein [Halalkaliarchaeum desulfuricum]
MSDSTVPSTNTEDDDRVQEDSSQEATSYEESSSDGHDHDTDQTLGHPDDHVEVTMESDEYGHHFVPHVVHIEPGGTVTWVLDSGVHDTVAYHPMNASILPSATEQRMPDGVDPWASDVYDRTGETFELTFEEEGIYDYTCTISGHGHRGDDHHGGHHGGHQTHESTGMVGRVIVGDPPLDADVQPAMRPPSRKLPDGARHELEQFNDQTRAALEDEDTSYEESDSDDHDHDTDHTLGHPEDHVEVTMESDEYGNHFVPHAVHIEPGGTVTWVLDSGVHDTVAYHPMNAAILPSASEQRMPDGVDPWASDVYDRTGETFELTFEEEGIYDYACTISGHGHRGDDHHGGHQTHESTGMVGRVIVGDPPLDADVQPAMRRPSRELPDGARHELETFNDQTRAALEEH